MKWYVPIICMLIVAVAQLSYNQGVADGKEAERAVYDKTDQAMADMGFCEWTRKARWISKCWVEQQMSGDD